MPADLDRRRPIGRFSSADLPAVHGAAAFRQAILDDAAMDCVCNHAPERVVDVVPAGLAQGISRFGPGRSVNAQMQENPLHKVKAVASVALDGALLSPDSMAILSPERGFLDVSVGNLAIWQNRLSKADPNFLDLATGDDPAPRWAFADPDCEIGEVDAVALPVGGIGCANYGHFLYDGLPAVMLHADLLGGAAVIAGRPLTPWQAEILDALGLRDRYVAIERPTRFRRIVTSDMIAFTVSYPSRLIRPLFDRLRYRFGAGGGRGRRLLVLRLHDGNRRVLADREAIEAVAGEWGFETVRPETLDVAGQARLFAQAEWVIGESGAALANLGFCDPGTRVLEIQPERFADGWTRAACHLLGHDWRVWFAATVPGSITEDGRGFAYRVDPDAFRQALGRVFGPPRLARGTGGALTVAPRGLAPGRILFGAARPGWTTLVPRTAQLSAPATRILRDAVLVPEPFSVMDADGVCRGGSVLTRGEAAPAERRVAGTMLALAAGPAVPLGRFLGDICGQALAVREEVGPTTLAGAAPTESQAAALAALGLGDAHRVLDAPARIDRLLLPDAAPAPGPGRMTRLAIERLRFLVEPYPASERIAILGRGRIGRVAIENMEALGARLRHEAFAMLDPESMRLDRTALGLLDLAAALAACRLVVIGDPAQAALLGFCDPGTLVIELAVDGAPGAAVAACCRLFSLEWRAVLAPAPRYAVLGRAAVTEGALLRTRIDESGLADALAAPAQG